MKHTFSAIETLYEKPLLTLVREASATHARYFPKNQIQASALLSIKTGGCPENCAYCPQSAHNNSGIIRQALLKKDQVLAAAELAKANGASRFCMGAAWREIKDGPAFDHVLDLVESVRAVGLQVCCTLGMLTEAQAQRLKQAGLHFYNHNLDTSPAFYKTIVQTRTYEERLLTLENVRRAGLSVCTGGILGLGESHQDRIELIVELVRLDPVPESITVNTLVPFDGTPLSDNAPVDSLDLVRFIACLRVLAPQSMIRLSAGRLALSEEAQFLCFLAGANSIFLGEKLLTSPNPEASSDITLLKKIGAELSEVIPYD